MKQDILLHASRGVHDRAHALRMPSETWHAIRRAAVAHGAPDLEVVYEPFAGLLFARFLREALKPPRRVESGRRRNPFMPVPDQAMAIRADAFAPVIADVLRLFDRGLGVRIEKCTAASLRVRAG